MALTVLDRVGRDAGVLILDFMVESFMRSIMALSIKNEATEHLARSVAAETGETLTEAIRIALEERFERIRGRRTGPDLAARLMAISDRCGRLPDRDSRTTDEILGYDEVGTFG